MRSARYLERTVGKGRRRDHCRDQHVIWLRGVSVLTLAAILATVASTTAAAQTTPRPFGPYDGSIPFRCVLQQAGTGAEFQDPGADPFCVEYDKTNQNVTDFGLVEFLALEPARVAAALPKCFYFQRDHWTGSIVQGAEPELWHWDGNYWYDRARGVGGVSVANFRVGGTPMDASPYAPDPYKPFFHPGGGGGSQMLLESGPDPSCAARVDTPAERQEVYADTPLAPGCIEPRGRLRGPRVGRVRLGMDRAAVLSRLGAPRSHARGADRWCLVGEGTLRVRYRGADGPATVIRTSGRGHGAQGVRPSDRARRAFKRLDLRPLLRLRRTRVLEAAAGERRRLVVGIAAGRVRWLAVAEPGLGTGKRLRRALAATR